MNLAPGRIATLAVLLCGLSTAPAVALTLTPPLQVGPISLPPLTVPGTGTGTGATGTGTGTATGGTGSATSGLGGVVTTVTDAAGQVVSTLESATGTAGAVPVSTGTVDTLIVSLLGGSAPTGSTPGSTGSSPSSTPTGTTGAGAGSGPTSAPATPDLKAPKVTFRLLTKLRSAAKTGRLRLRVRSSEESVVALAPMLRIHAARRVHGRPLRVSRALVHLRPAVLAFRKAGAQTVTVKLPARWRRNLARASTARVTVQGWAADRARNQSHAALKRLLRR